MKRFFTWLTCFVMGHDWSMYRYLYQGGRNGQFFYECRRCTANTQRPVTF